MTAFPTIPAPGVIKRDGSAMPFDAARIDAALLRAGLAAGAFDAVEAARLGAIVVCQLAQPGAGAALHVEQVQDAVEAVLYQAGHRRALRAFVVYREQHHVLRRERRSTVDVESSINEYLEQRDWRVNANANQGYSLGGLILNVSGKVIANYWLNHVYPPEIGQAHRDADLHIHDLDMLAGYCAGWSLRTLLHAGLNGVPGKVEAGPPKHMFYRAQRRAGRLRWGRAS